MFEVIKKVCTKCGKNKPLDDFRKYAGRSKDGRRPICRECQNAYDREYSARKRAEKEGA
jgi:transposase-like protein